jgi:MoaA/NifB/PqqE/SkfB family radical SAM enzyme
MAGFWRNVFAESTRKKTWFLENLTSRKVLNLVLAVAEFLLKRERMRAWPVALKIDISPLCNLHCTVCVHAKPNGEGYLEKQYFHPGHRMSVEQYRRIIGEIRGKSTAVSLYYLGDPLMHPDLDAMCRIAREAGLNVHISTNFSFRLTDGRLQRLLQSGVTHITVCVDGLSQEKFEKTRVGGKIEWVLSNLRRLCRYRQEAGGRYPKIEVQYIAFAHNREELEPARRLCKELRVNQFSVLEGSTDNWAARLPEKYTVHEAKPDRLLPQCVWPHFFMLVKYNGDVIPCCHHRIGEQYSKSDDSRSTGNLLQAGVREIWNSPKYRQMRRLVSNPSKVSLEADATESFCYGCPRVYRVTERAAAPVAVEISID